MTIVVIKPDTVYSPTKDLINDLIISLQLDAKRNEQLERLIIERDEEVANCYDFSYGCAKWGDQSDSHPYTTGTDTIAINIIALKDYYAKRIRKCQIRHARFKALLEELPDEDSEILAKAFCTDISVDERDVKKVIKKHLPLIEDRYFDQVFNRREG